MRDVLRDEILGEEALIEHATAKDLIATLEALEPGEPFYDATFTVLAEYVKHHVKEEETEMFPQVKKAKLNLNELGAQMKQRKEELEDENGPIENGPVPEFRAERRQSVEPHGVNPRREAELKRIRSRSSANRAQCHGTGVTGGTGVGGCGGGVESSSDSGSSIGGGVSSGGSLIGLPGAANADRTRFSTRRPTRPSVITW